GAGARGRGHEARPQRPTCPSNRWRPAALPVLGDRAGTVRQDEPRARTCPYVDLASTLARASHLIAVSISRRAELVLQHLIEALSPPDEAQRPVGVQHDFGSLRV